MLRKYLFPTILIVLILASCKEEDVPPEMPVLPPSGNDSVFVVLDSMPYSSLADYNFFSGESMSELIPNERVLLYKPITPLFTDYAEKSRYVWMPEGVSASYVSDFESFDFPDGAILIKNFFYNNISPGDERRVMETRLLFKRNGEWEFADYIWNDEQDEAISSLDGAVKPINIVFENGEALSIDYRIPSESECITCHKVGEMPSPNGPKPQNLNAELTYSDGAMNQLMKWTEAGYLTADYPSDIATMVDWQDQTASLQDRVRAYLDANCGHCHKENAHCAYRNIRLDFENNDRDVNLGVCVPFDEFVPGQPFDMENIIEAGNAEKSMLIYRMIAEEENVQMPLIGKSVVHYEGLDLLTNYINSLEETCN